MKKNISKFFKCIQLSFVLVFAFIAVDLQSSNSRKISSNKVTNKKSTIRKPSSPSHHTQNQQSLPQASPQSQPVQQQVVVAVAPQNQQANEDALLKKELANFSEEIKKYVDSYEKSIKLEKDKLFKLIVGSKKNKKGGGDGLRSQLDKALASAHEQLNGMQQQAYQIDPENASYKGNVDNECQKVKSALDEIKVPEVSKIDLQTSQIFELKAKLGFLVNQIKDSSTRDAIQKILIGLERFKKNRDKNDSKKNLLDSEFSNGIKNISTDLERLKYAGENIHFDEESFDEEISKVTAAYQQPFTDAKQSINEVMNSLNTALAAIKQQQQKEIDDQKAQQQKAIEAQKAEQDRLAHRSLFEKGKDAVVNIVEEHKEQIADAGKKFFEEHKGDLENVGKKALNWFKKLI